MIQNTCADYGKNAIGATTDFLSTTKTLGLWAAEILGVLNLSLLNLKITLNIIMQLLFETRYI